MFLQKLLNYFELVERDLLARSTRESSLLLLLLKASKEKLKLPNYSTKFRDKPFSLGPTRQEALHYSIGFLATDLNSSVPNREKNFPVCFLRIRPSDILFWEKQNKSDLYLSIWIISWNFPTQYRSFNLIVIPLMTFCFSLVVYEISLVLFI